MEETAQRIEIIKRALVLEAEQRRMPPTSLEDRVTIATSFEYALVVPTRHLEEAFRLAMQQHDPGFPMQAYEVNKVYRDDMLPEIQRASQNEAYEAAQDDTTRLLMPGRDRSGLTSKEAMEIEEAQSYHGPIDPKWWVRKSYPWDLYAGSVDKCPELDFTGDCPGYVIEYSGPNKDWTKRRRCPLHSQRWDGRQAE